MKAAHDLSKKRYLKIKKKKEQPGLHGERVEPA